jgi:hypothetical protein
MAAVNDVVDELGELLTKQLPRDSLIGHLAWALYGAFLPHTDLDQAERTAAGGRTLGSRRRSHQATSWPIQSKPANGWRTDLRVAEWF